MDESLFSRNAAYSSNVFCIIYPLRPLWKSSCVVRINAQNSKQNYFGTSKRHKKKKMEVKVMEHLIAACTTEDDKEEDTGQDQEDNASAQQSEE